MTSNEALYIHTLVILHGNSITKYKAQVLVTKMECFKGKNNFFRVTINHLPDIN